MPFYVGNVISRAGECTGIGVVDPTFIDPGFDSTVRKIIIQPDQKIIVGGSFNRVETTTVCHSIVRLNFDGTRDTSFLLRNNVGINGGVNALALQPDGKIIIGGGFTVVSGQTVNRICRLNADGTLDTTFNTGANRGANGGVFSLALQADGKVVVGGIFNTMRGVTQNGIARLNSDGSLDTGFNTGANPGMSLSGSGFADNTEVIIVQPDNKILVGGTFETVRGVVQNGYARLETDGSLDTGFNTGANPGVAGLGVFAMQLRDDGKILVGGEWNALRGTILDNISRDIGRINSDGSRDTAWPLISNTATTTRVESILPQYDNKIFVGGFFEDMKGQTTNDYCRLLENGNIDTAYNVPPPAGIGLTAPTGLFATWVYDAALQDDCRILIGGVFTEVRGSTRHYMARLA